MTNRERLAIRAFFDEATNTISYLIWDREAKKAAVIDPVLDFDNRSGKASTRSADTILKAVAVEGVAVEWVLETHAHADHLSAAPHIKNATGGQIGIGEHIRDVQAIFGPYFNLTDLSGEGTEFDRLFRDSERIRLGGLDISIMHLPGHTPACIAYHVEDVVFVGDTIFMPDYGTARADFPGGDARTLYRSVQKLLSLPDETRLFLCHDYKAPGRDEYVWETTVRAEKENVHLAGTGEDDFVAWRNDRDAGLPAPMLLLPAIQTNIRAGHLPEPEANGKRYLKLPITVTAPDTPSA